MLPLMFEGYTPEYTHFRGHGNGAKPRFLRRKNLLARLTSEISICEMAGTRLRHIHNHMPFSEVAPPQDAI